MSKTNEKFISINLKVTFLILILALTSIVGVSSLLSNGLRMQKISYDFIGKYEEALAGVAKNYGNLLGGGAFLRSRVCAGLATKAAEMNFPK